MANFEVMRILVDHGSWTEIMCVRLLAKLGISEKDLTPYRGSDFSGFNRSK